MGGHGAPVGDINNTFRVLVGNPGDRRTRCSPRRTMEDNIKLGLLGERALILQDQGGDKWQSFVNAAMKL